MTLAMPPKSAMRRVWRRSYNMPDEQKERARRETVIDHLQNAAADSLRVEREQTQHHESQVRDARKGDERFDISLDDGNNRAVNDADDRKRDEDRRKSFRGFGEQAAC